MYFIKIESNYIRYVLIGKFIICEIPNENLEIQIKNKREDIIIETDYNQFLILKNKKSFLIESENYIRKMWFCKIISNEEIFNINPNFQIIEKFNHIPYVNIIYGRCNDSMIFLDKLYRNYITKHKFENNQIVAIKSVAGSGKTTTLLELSKIHNKKKILYIAFNKSLITEIKEKIKKNNIKNLFPYTFDSLMREIFIIKNNIEILDIIDLKSNNIGNILNWFQNKPYRVKNYYIKNFSNFCNQIEYNDINTYSEKVLGNKKNLLEEMWKKVLNYELITFDSIRKLVFINRLCLDIIDKKYDLIFIDESQDFDNVMLKILLRDTILPKLFVGDPLQAIYEWKGCINAFDKLPESSLIFEFYSTFRVGNPACDLISNLFYNCNMISKSSNITNLKYDIVPTVKYTYLFRNWRNLLQTAQFIENIWINNYDSQIKYIRLLHDKVKKFGFNNDDYDEFSDDLPKFLLKLSMEELEKMINNIEKNISKKEESKVEFYTIHTYKGLENDVVRIYNDIDIENEPNLHYVALTRAKKLVIIDSRIPIYDQNILNNDRKKQLYFTNNNFS